MAERYGPLKPEDIEAVVSLVLGPGGVGLSPEFHWPEEALRPEAQFHSGWGAWRDGRLVAFVLWRDLKDEGEITVLATHPDFLRQGIMYWLLKTVFAAHGQMAWLLEVHERNLSALGLYRGLGFQPVGQRMGYYRDGATALVYRRAPEIR
jgi:ribosomal-protein-alanine N-acetyltransferase